MATESYDVFVSYARTDWRHAADINSVLRSKGLRSFFDRCSLAAGLRWLKSLEPAIGAAKAAIVLIGSRGLGNTQQSRPCLDPPDPRSGFYSRARDPVRDNERSSVASEY